MTCQTLKLTEQKMTGKKWRAKSLKSQGFGAQSFGFGFCNLQSKRTKIDRTICSLLSPHAYSHFDFEYNFQVIEFVFVWHISFVDMEMVCGELCFDKKQISLLIYVVQPVCRPIFGSKFFRRDTLPTLVWFLLIIFCLWKNRKIVIK